MAGVFGPPTRRARERRTLGRDDLRGGLRTLRLAPGADRRRRLADLRGARRARPPLRLGAARARDRARLPRRHRRPQLPRLHRGLARDLRRRLRPRRAELQTAPGGGRRDRRRLRGVGPRRQPRMGGAARRDPRGGGPARRRPRPRDRAGDRLRGTARRRDPRAARGAAPRRRLRRAPLHLGDDRGAEGGDADPRQLGGDDAELDGRDAAARPRRRDPPRRPAVPPERLLRADLLGPRRRPPRPRGLRPGRRARRDREAARLGDPAGADDAEHDAARAGRGSRAGLLQPAGGDVRGIGDRSRPARPRGGGVRRRLRRVLRPLGDADAADRALAARPRIRPRRADPRRGSPRPGGRTRSSSCGSRARTAPRWRSARWGRSSSAATT